MSRIILVSNASHDAPTEYLASWFSGIVDLLKQRTDTILFELKKDKANRKEFTKLIERENPQFVIFNGHGNDELIAGFNQDILVRCDDNESILEGKIVHSMACESAKKLGQKCIIIGTKSFIGYKEKFNLVHLNKKSETEQLGDPIAEFFLKPAYEVVAALVEGEKTGTAYIRSQNMYREKLTVLLTSDNTEYNTVLASRLYHNFQNQVCLGDQVASF
jgi:hypothetical protein